MRQEIRDVIQAAADESRDAAARAVGESTGAARAEQPTAVERAAAERRTERYQRFRNDARAPRFGTEVPFSEEDRRRRLWALCERVFYIEVEREGDHPWVDEDRTEMQRLVASLPTNPDVRCSSRNPYEALGLDARRLDTIEHTDVAAAYVAALRQIDIPAALTRTQRDSAMARVGQAVDATARLMTTTDQRARIDQQLRQDLAPLRDVASPIADAAYSGYCRAISEGREANVEALVQQATSALHIDIDALMDNPGGQAQQGRHRAQGQFGIASARAGTDWFGSMAEL